MLRLVFQSSHPVRKLPNHYGKEFYIRCVGILWALVVIKHLHLSGDLSSNDASKVMILNYYFFSNCTRNFIELPLSFHWTSPALFIRFWHAFPTPHYHSTALFTILLFHDMEHTTNIYAKKTTCVTVRLDYKLVI